MLCLYIIKLDIMQQEKRAVSLGKWMSSISSLVGLNESLIYKTNSGSLEGCFGHELLLTGERWRGVSYMDGKNNIQGRVRIQALGTRSNGWLVI